jgi:hypothetical protein
MVLSGPKRVSAISSLTNKGCIFGSMAGMPPTIGVPSSIVGVYQKETSYCNFCLPPGCKDGFAYLKAKGLLSGNKGAGGVGRMQYMPGFNNLMGGVANYSGRGHVSSSSSQATPALTQTVTFTGTVNFEIIYVNSSNQVVTVTGPVLNGFTIYRVTYTSAGASYVINSYLPSTSISFLIVGGGGSGAYDLINFPGGGGAGGFIESSGTTNSNSPYSIYVGRGGVPLNSTANGENSLLQLNSGILTAIGGGGGGNFSTNLNGLNGGSGGGGAFDYSNGNFGSGGSGVNGQGFSGSAGSVGGDLASSGGGAGGNAYLNGGPGLSSIITGTTTFYAGGGGGATRTGGIGGGGSGIEENRTPGTDGLGGGGGIGLPGGSGVVILRIPSFA